MDELEKTRKMELLKEMNKLKFENIDLSSTKQEEVNNNLEMTEQSKVESYENKQTIEEELFEIKDDKSNDNSEEKVIKTQEEEKQLEEPKQINNKTELKKEIEQNKANTEVSYFTGNLLDLFGWTYLKCVLSCITLSLGAPWGKCMYLKYKLGQTVLSGKKLSFIGDGSELFVEQFKWSFLTLITFGIYGLWVPIKKTKWIVSKIRFEEDLNSNNSVFCGSMIRLLGINLLCILITVISFGILYPVAECIKLRWLAKNTIINNRVLKFEGRILNLYGKYILWVFLTIITFGIYGLWVGLKKINWEVENTVLV